MIKTFIAVEDCNYPFLCVGDPDTDANAEWEYLPMTAIDYFLLCGDYEPHEVTTKLLLMNEVPL